MSLEKMKLALQNVLPEIIFKEILKLWRLYLLPIKINLDGFRLKSFKNEKWVTVRHESINFELLINPENGGVDHYIFLNGVYEQFILSRIKSELN